MFLSANSYKAVKLENRSVPKGLAETHIQNEDEYCRIAKYSLE